MEKQLVDGRALLRKLSYRIILAEQAAEEARQICHQIQELLFDIEDDKVDFATLQFLMRKGG